MVALALIGIGTGKLRNSIVERVAVAEYPLLCAGEPARACDGASAQAQNCLALTGIYKDQPLS